MASDLWTTVDRFLPLADGLAIGHCLVLQQSPEHRDFELPVEAQRYQIGERGARVWQP